MAAIPGYQVLQPMTDILALLSLIAFLATALLLTRLLKPRGVVDFGLIYCLLFSALLVGAGYLLSALTLLNQIGWWTAAGLLALALTLASVALLPTARGVVFSRMELPPDIETRIRKTPWNFSTCLLAVLGGTVALTTLINFAVLMWLEPATLDALDYHLARIAYYLQYGSMRYFPANYWNQVAYPKVATVLQLYSYLVSGRIDSLMQLVQYVAYFVSIGALYGISRFLGAGRKASAVAALIFALLPICLMESITAQNDLVLSAYLGLLLYFLLAYRHSGAFKYLALAALAVSLMIGVKFTFVMTLPAVAVIAVLLLWRRRAPAPSGARGSGAAAGAAALHGAVRVCRELPALPRLLRTQHLPGGNDVREEIPARIPRGRRAQFAALCHRLRRGGRVPAEYAPGGSDHPLAHRHDQAGATGRGGSAEAAGVATLV